MQILIEETQIKEIVIDFFYWWWNQDGVNTSQGFDDWWENIYKKEVTK